MMDLPQADLGINVVSLNVQRQEARKTSQKSKTKWMMALERAMRPRVQQSRTSVIAALYWSNRAQT
jgi:hypothetical protein